jgi:hypothetical protein
MPLYAVDQSGRFSALLWFRDPIASWAFRTKALHTSALGSKTRDEPVPINRLDPVICLTVYRAAIRVIGKSGKSFRRALRHNEFQGGK